MPKKTENKCVHMTESENRRLERMADVSGRRCSQLIHDALTVAIFQPGGSEQRIAETRLAQARELVSDSQNSFVSLGIVRSEGAEGDDEIRFSRLLEQAKRPEVLHG